MRKVALFSMLVVGLVFGLAGSIHYASAEASSPTPAEVRARQVSAILLQEMPAHAVRLLLTAESDGSQRCAYQIDTETHPTAMGTAVRERFFVATMPATQAIQQWKASTSYPGWQVSQSVPGGRPLEALPAFDAQAFRAVVANCVAASHEVAEAQAPGLRTPADE